MSTETTLSLEAHPALDRTRAIFYYDFAPILARSAGLRQNPERAQIMCEQCVRKLAPGEIVLPQTSGFYLLIQSASGVAAEALAHDINIALLELFFGTEALKELGSICRRATLTEIHEKGFTVSQPQDTAPARSKPFTVEDPFKRLTDAGVTGFDGLKTVFLPLTNLRSNASAVFLCGPMRQSEGQVLFGVAALAGLQIQDRAALDVAMLEHSCQFANHVMPTKSAAAIIASVSYETLASPRGRRLYQQALRNLGVAKNPFLVVKIDGIPSDMHATRCAEIVAMVRPFVRRVFLEASHWSPELMRGPFLGVAGLVATMPEEISLNGAGRIISGVAQLAAAQQAIACILNLRGPNQFALARTAGIRFATERSQNPGAYLEMPAIGLEAESLAA